MSGLLIVLSMALLCVATIFLVGWARQKNYIGDRLAHFLLVGGFAVSVLLGTVLNLQWRHYRHEQRAHHASTLLLGNEGAHLSSKALEGCPKNAVPVLYAGATWCLVKAGKDLRLEKAQPRAALKRQPEGITPPPAKPPTQGALGHYADVIYFFVLVLGVLAKFYWDWYEQRKTNPELHFDMQQILLSFILAVLVYVGVYANLEKQNGLSTSGLLACFQNGFFFQTIFGRKSPEESGDNHAP